MQTMAIVGGARWTELAPSDPSVSARPPSPPEMPASEEPSTMRPDAASRFHRLVEAQFDFIWRALRGLGVPMASADDAAQQVFIIAARKMETIAVGSERSFLFSTAVGVAANARRSLARSREVVDEESLAKHLDDAPDPEQITAARQARRVLDQILDGLPEDVRSVFVLFELEGMTTAEIAELLMLPLGTVASKLRRAREEFQAAARRFQATASGRKVGS